MPSQNNALTPNQLGIWTRTKVYGENNEYLIPLVLPVPGHIGRATIENALNETIRCHGALRTVVVDGDPVHQRIDHFHPVTLPMVQGERQVIESSMKKYLEEGISLDVPLAQYHLFIAQDVQYLVCKFHHIIFDAHSAQLFQQDFERCLTIGKLHKEESLYTQYLEDSSEENQNERIFWERYLSQQINKLTSSHKLSASSKARDQERMVVRNRLNCSLDEFKQYSTAVGGTLFSAGLAAFQLFTGRYFDLDAVATAIPISIRRTASESETIGFLANVLPVITVLDRNSSAYELHKDIQSTIITLIENGSISNSDIHRIVQADAINRYEDLYQMVFDLKLDDESFESALIYSSSVNSEYGFLANLVIKGEAVYLETNVDASVYSKSLIDSLHDSFSAFFTSLVNSVHSPVGDHHVISDKQQEALMKKHSDLSKSPENSEGLIFQTGIPGAVAISYNDYELSYGELERYTRDFKKKLEMFGVGQGAKFAVVAENKLLAAVLFYCIQQAGHCYIPISPKSPEKRIRKIIEEAKPLLVFSDCLEPQMDNLIEVSPDKIFDALTEAKLMHRDDKARYEKGISYIIFTSGSTGKPKGVPISAGNIASLAAAYPEFDIHSHDVVAQIASLSFDASIFEYTLAFCNGAELAVFDDQKGYEQFPRFTCERKVTHFLMTPEYYAVLDFSKCASLKTVLVGGAPYRENKTVPAGVAVLNAYGPSECSIITSFKAMNAGTSVANIGQPLGQVHYLVLDSSDQIVPKGQQGQLCIAGPGVFNGYLAGEESPFVTLRIGHVDVSYFKTGDIVYQDEINDIHFVTRNAELVKLRGNRINPEEITQLILKHTTVTNSATVFHCDQLYSFFVGNVSAEELRDLCKLHLPDYMVPKKIIELDAIPMTINGKTDLQYLKNHIDRDKASGKQADEAPASASLDERILTVFRTVLDDADLAKDANFFELGGDSIKSIQLANEFQKKGIHITSIDIMNSETLGELSEKALKTKPIFNQQPLSGSCELLPIQQWFFSHEFTNMHQWNQSIEFQVEGELTEKDIMNIYAEIRNKHDALRSNFVDVGGKREIVIKPNISKDVADELEFFNMSTATELEIAELKTRMFNTLQLGLDVEKGSLSKLAVIQTSNRSFTIMWVMHHLICDNVSWMILQNDFETAVDQLSNKELLCLSEKTTNIREFSAFVNSEIIPEGIAANWEEALESAHAGQFSNKLTPAPVSSRYQTAVFELSEEESASLQLYAKKKYYTPDLLLLLLFGKALAEEIELDKVWITRELNGRNGFGENLLLHQTVGWLTSLHPVSIRNSPKFHEFISANYFEIERLGKHAKYYQRLSDKMTLPNISYNYLGDLDQLPSVDEKQNIGSYDFFDEIALNAGFVNGRLSFIFLFQENREQMIRELFWKLKELMKLLDGEDGVNVFGLDQDTLLNLDELFKI